MLTHVLEMCEKISQFLCNQGSNLVEDFESRGFNFLQVYMADVFTHQKELNTSMQRTGMNMVKAREKLICFYSEISSLDKAC
jgi:hypothetical protein